MQASRNAGDVLKTHRQSTSFTDRKLTRQRKLRHVTDDELGLSPINPSFSSPASPDSARKSRSPDHWSSFAVPIPLPLPEVQILRRRESPTSNSDDGSGSAFGRKSSTSSAKCSSYFHKGETKDLRAETTNNDSRQSVRVRNSPTSGLPSPAVNSQKSNPFPSHDSKSLNTRRRGFSHDLKIEMVDHNLRRDVSPKSAPTSVFSSPAVSPQRSKTGDLFSSFWAPHEIQAWSTVDAGCISPASPLKRSVYSNSADHSPCHSPTMQSPKMNQRSPKFAFPSHHKSLPQNSKEWPESNSHLDAHPLPLPPAALAQQQSSMPSVAHPITEMPNASARKNQWQKGKLIGCGTFGSVYIATNRETGALCAMKEVDIIPDDPKSAECIKQLEQEIRVLRQLKNPNIVQYYGSEVVDDQFYIYLEYVHPGSINKYVRDHFGAITESIVRNFTRHILSGLAYLHSKKTIHRDIKGANLLVDASGVVKLADFGMAKHLTGLSYELSLKGSPYWMAPELMQAMMLQDANPNLAFAVDIWSLGCTVIEMFTGKPPWSDLTGPQAMFQVLHKSPPIPETLSSEGKNFLQRCFRRNPAERPSAISLLEHPFVRNSSDQNVSVWIQDFSKINLLDKSHSPINSATHKKDLKLNSPDKLKRNNKLPCNSETCQQCYVGTFNCATASHHSPCSTVGVNPPPATTQLIHNSLNFSPSSNVSTNLPLSAVNNHPCSLSRTRGREVKQI